MYINARRHSLAIILLNSSMHFYTSCNIILYSPWLEPWTSVFKADAKAPSYWGISQLHYFWGLINFCFDMDCIIDYVKEGFVCVSSCSTFLGVGSHIFIASATVFWLGRTNFFNLTVKANLNLIQNLLISVH